MKQQVSPILGVVIAVLVVAVIGLAYMATHKAGPPPPPSIASPSPGQKMSLPGMDQTRAPSNGPGGSPGGGMSLPGAGGGSGGGMPMAPPAPN
jgi:hypothetical protein